MHVPLCLLGLLYGKRKEEDEEVGRVGMEFCQTESEFIMVELPSVDPSIASLSPLSASPPSPPPPAPAWL